MAIEAYFASYSKKTEEQWVEPIEAGEVLVTKYFRPMGTMLILDIDDEILTLSFANPTRRMHARLFENDEDRDGIELNPEQLFIRMKRGESISIINRKENPTRELYLVFSDRDSDEGGLNEDSAPVQPTPMIDLV